MRLLAKFFGEFIGVSSWNFFVPETVMALGLTRNVVQLSGQVIVKAGLPEQQRKKILFCLSLGRSLYGGPRSHQGRLSRYLQSRAIPRLGRPEDIARAVRFFLEPDTYVTGQVLVADGGLTLRHDRV